MCSNQRNTRGISTAFFILAVTLILSISCASEGKRDSLNLTDSAKQEFLDARFGLFIHFGIFSLPAGVWKGDTIPVGGMSEHIMRLLRIPRNDYHEIAKQFNPSEFDAEKIVNLAREAGMKYIVITAKHHDGFAMFDSDYDDYNIKDGTPYGKDLLKELSIECEKQGMKLGLYYSHIRDWDEYNSVTSYNNDWDWPKDDSARNSAVYIKAKVLPQLTELLTNYGDIFCLWFDTPYSIPKDQATEIYDLVKKLQPSCLVNSRIGAGLGDYGVMGDNQIPPGVLSGVWECPATMNHSWGFHQTDNTWKSSKHMIMQLADLSSKNINYLLNIGPKADGSVPQESIKRLEEIGDWIKKNGEAIYGTGPSPWFQEMDSFRVTTREEILYITLFNSDLDKITLYNLNNEVVKAEILANGNQVPFEVKKLTVPEVSMLTLSIPEEIHEEILPVIKLTLGDIPDVSDQSTQMSSGNILLPVGMAKLSRKGDNLEVSGLDGVLDTNNWPYFATRNWTNTEDYIEWDFNLIEPGNFEVELINVSTVRDFKSYQKKWNSVYKSSGDYCKVTFSIGNQSVTGNITGQDKVQSIRSAYRPEFVNSIGFIDIDRPGTYPAVLQADFINPLDADGIVIYEVRLVKTK